MSEDRAEIRCPAKKHGELIGGTVFEVKCRSIFCGAAAGFVVLHRFDGETGELIETRKFADPAHRKE